jgi:hypothetical protein
LCGFDDCPVVADERSVVAFRVVDVAVAEDVGVATKVRVVLCGWVNDKSRGKGRFADVEDGNGIAGGLCSEYLTFMTCVTGSVRIRPVR